ncbi:MAG TPA: hypothetical protein V6D19_06105 [Stenomitos sp.]
MSKVNVSPMFAVVFASVLLLTLLLGGLAFWLAGQGNLSDQQIALFNTCNAAWYMGVASIFGLLGGKAVNLIK